MQLHQLKPNHKLKKKKRVGRGGKRGTYSGRGIKGQKARSGSKRKPGFEGGRTPLWRQLPKKKGFKSIHLKPMAINLNLLEQKFSDGDLITPRELCKKGLIDNIKLGAKILGQGEITKKLIVKNCSISKSAKEKIEKAGGKVSQKLEVHKVKS